jgi:hypothetical protein
VAVEAAAAGDGPRSEVPLSSAFRTGAVGVIGLERSNAEDRVGCTEADFERCSEVVEGTLIELRRSSKDINSAINPRSTQKSRQTSKRMTIGSYIESLTR